MRDAYRPHSALVCSKLVRHVRVLRAELSTERRVAWPRHSAPPAPPVFAANPLTRVSLSITLRRNLQPDRVGYNTLSSPAPALNVKGLVYTTLLEPITDAAPLSQSSHR